MCAWSVRLLSNSVAPSSVSSFLDSFWKPNVAPPGAVKGPVWFCAYSATASWYNVKFARRLSSDVEG